jgi:two-component system cell cycle sensor histidine kinase/response regulator CckA
MNVLIAEGNSDRIQPMMVEPENDYLTLNERCRVAELAVEISVTLTRGDELSECLRTCAESMAKHLDAALIGIWTLHDRALELWAIAAADEPPPGVEIGQAIAERIAEERSSYRTNAVLSDLGTHEQDWARRAGVLAFTGFPLIIEERLVGVLGIFTQQELPEAMMETLAAIADAVAGCIRCKWTEEELRESESRFRQLAENISEVLWMTDPVEREVLYVSPVCESVWGRSGRSLLEQPNLFFDAIHPDDRPRVLGTLQSELDAPYELEYRIVRPDSNVRWIRERAFPIRDAEGRVNRVAHVSEDVTERRQREMLLRQSQKMEAVGRLAGGVAHDFNNLLSVIFGHSALLAASAPSRERVRDSVAEINRAAEQAAALTQQLLAFGRRQLLEPRVLDLGSVLAESRSLLRRVIGEGVRLKMLLAPRLRQVNADPGQINQILLNLALNARDAMPEGGELTIETRDVDFDAEFATAHPETRPGSYVLLAVTDTGTGMTPEVRSRIFEPFFSTKSDSTGLGLSVVDGIVSQNGGYLTVATDPGLGTTFSIYLPAVEEPLKRPSRSVSAKPAVSNETILLVEDEDSVREVTALLLESLGYRVLQVASAEEALALAQSKKARIDLLFTDVIMPGMSGWELAEAFRTHDPRIKVLFQSGHTDDIVVRLGILNSEVAFLQKPFSLGSLGKKIRELFDQK